MVMVFSIAASADTVLIEEWDLPSTSSFPHDPAVAPDGSLWYTDMLSDTLGRLDFSTGKIKEFSLRIRKSAPHGLVVDKSGYVWFTANHKAYIGKLDPRTGEVKTYPMPDPAASDPHTPIFDHKGILWFTVQGGNFIGRLDPLSGTIRLKRFPTPRSRPYGIAISAAGVPYVSEFGTNKLARISPATMDITEYELPKGARPRRLAVSPNNMIYYTDYARGRLGRFSPKTKKVEDWPSPGGPDSAPYGLAITPDGKVWYSESGIKPNTIVRFDPESLKFWSWPIPSGGGVVRNIISTPEGDLFIACSGVSKVGRVKTKHAAGK